MTAGPSSGGPANAKTAGTQRSRQSGPREHRAAVIAAAGSLDAALSSGALDAFQDITLSEAVVLGLLRQGIRTYIGIFGHGSTDLGEALRVYAEAGLVEVFDVHSEVEASHAATALRWQYGKPAAVFTSIGPGALHALSASLVPASNGIGVYYLFGDETTHDEGFNMQQVPLHQQMSYLKLASAMGNAYSVHTGEALPAALKRGAGTVFAPARAAPFYLFLPMNVQCRMMPGFNLDEFPRVPAFTRTAPVDDAPYEEAVRMLSAAAKVVVKTGNGARGVETALLSEFLDRTDAGYVHGPSAVGIIPGSNPRNMTVGGSKGSICGNVVMAEAELVVTIGARSVCQWDSSGTAWKNARSIIAINADPLDATHYNRTLPLIGDASAVLERLVAALRKAGVDKGSMHRSAPTPWFKQLRAWREQWDSFLESRFEVEPLTDPKFRMPLLTQPAAIREVVEFARAKGACKYFDAGDVQANGFQIVEDDTPNMTFNETGASYMGFAACGILASAFADRPVYPIAFTGDGSFIMNPQILFDAVHHGLRGMIALFDNRRMAAISGLQLAQYGREFRTDDETAVDYAALARAVKGVGGFYAGTDRASLRRALEEAYAFDGLSVVHVPVYAGPDERGGLGAYGDWNVGSWCERVQREKHRLGL